VNLQLQDNASCNLSGGTSNLKPLTIACLKHHPNIDDIPSEDRMYIRGLQDRRIIMKKQLICCQLPLNQDKISLAAQKKSACSLGLGPPIYSKSSVGHWNYYHLNLLRRK